eukprot:CAMPEP_0201523844 /NCGR_PEP_ID=MMETSP0161_2-20130828/20958_1 /ASSEMBLY_ACC=CAM_ASM_000251 /TAXON_ID=180227 /ORGANISM="Neoparamoeba aestuarina, Strain SoJaBio B1-5/56/2" /LENGTH=439 /DNA_ID=CAMNT_0047923069 /DNA_START=80 /DNA_END=1399 /DNA_ORIENTATION=-
MEDNQMKYFLVSETRQEFEQRKRNFASLTAAILAPSSTPFSLPPSWPTKLEIPEVRKAREVILSILPDLKAMAPIFVTGSSGYLGMSLIFLFQNLGIESRGFDIVPSPSTRTVGSIAEEEEVRKAMKGCKGVIHCAALHAPNLAYYSEADFEKVNIQGTQNVIKVALENNIKNIVFSSTTSLSISPLLKEMEKKEKGKILVVDHSCWRMFSDLDTQKKEFEKEIKADVSRNAYGRTKRAAEKCCFSFVEKEKERGGGLKIAILRCSRFFLEDVFDSDALKKTTTPNPTPTSTPTSTPLTSPNFKANELRTGVRISLIDLLLTHLLSLSHLHQQPDHCSFVFGPFVASSPTPLLRLSREEREGMTEKKDRVYAAMGWKDSSKHSSLSSGSSSSPNLRLYDSSLTWKSLAWTPYFDYQWLLKALEKDEQDEAKRFVELGLY